MTLLSCNCDVSHFGKAFYRSSTIRQPGKDKVRPTLRSRVFIVHVSAEGLLDPDDTDAENLFRSVVLLRLDYSNIDSIDIKGRDLVTEIDLITEVIEKDLIAMVNKKHRCIDRLFKNTDFKNTAYGTFRYSFILCLKYYPVRQSETVFKAA